MCKKKTCSCFSKQIVRKAKLSEFTTFKVGGKATIVCPRTTKEFVRVLRTLDESGTKTKVIGAGSNLLISDKKQKMVFVCTKSICEDFVLEQNYLTVSAGVNINQVILFCEKHHLSGLEKLFGIPATVGGMVVMNAGANGVNIFDRIVSILAFANGSVVSIDPQSVEKQNHWTEILNSNVTILKVTFELEFSDIKSISETIKKVTEKRMTSQPKGNSAGCVFANPQGDFSGRLIDQAGLKNAKVGHAFVSEKHANFIISENAKYKDILKLIRHVQKTVFDKFGIWLETEIEIIGEDNENNGRLSYPQQI